MGGKGSGRGSGGIRKGGMCDHPVVAPKKPPQELIDKHPNMTLLPDNPMNRMETMTVTEMADMINSIDPEEKIKRINFHNLACMAIAKHADRKNVESMYECFQAYVTLCGLTGMAIGNQGAYYCMGMESNVANQWLNGGAGSTPERKALISEVKRVCAMGREALGGAGQLNPVLTIFWQKNYDGLRDQQEHVVATANPLGERQSAEQIAEKYRGVIEIEE